MFESNKRLGEIAEISLLTNRWCMWADSNLPGHKTYVPAVFQTRDAYYHFIDLAAMGVGTDETPGMLRSDNVEDIGRFWTENPEMCSQLNEILHHISRGFFDVVDHICIQLVRQKKRSGSSDCYLWYDRQLRTYSTLAQQLRAEKSRTPEKTMQTVLKWDILLQHITSAYTIADEHARAEEAQTAVHRLLKKIEAAHTLDSIEKACKNYMDLKVQFEQINAGTDIIDRLTRLGERVSCVVLEDNADITSDFVDECERMKAEVEEICAKRYEELDNIHRKLSAANGALFSTTKVQRVRKRTEWLSQGVKSVFEMLAAAVPTYIVEKRLFQADPAAAAATIREMLNDDAVGLVLRYITALVLVHIVFTAANWTWWHITTEFQYYKSRKSLRKAMPRCMNGQNSGGGKYTTSGQESDRM